MNETEEILRTALKRIFNLPISTEVWPANQRIQYSTMMLYHTIMNGNLKRVAGKY